MSAPPTRLIIGCGYLGRRAAEAWIRAGDTVYAVTRSEQRGAEFQQSGLLPIVADVTVPASLAGLPPVDTLLYAVGFDRGAGPSMREVYVTGLKNVLAALPAEVKRLVYVSSTGVYGQKNGEWVDEDSVCEPVRENGRVCLEAEQALTGDARFGSRAIILRLAGIYGPGRIPRVATLLAGEPVPATATGHLNLIHVEDAVRVVQAAAAAPQAGRLYTVSDGEPAARRDYYRHLAQLVGAPEPVFVEPEPGSPQANRAEADKRVSNSRLLAELNMQLAYPSYREGLAAIIRS